MKSKSLVVIALGGAIVGMVGLSGLFAPSEEVGSERQDVEIAQDSASPLAQEIAAESGAIADRTNEIKNYLEALEAKKMAAKSQQKPSDEATPNERSFEGLLDQCVDRPSACSGEDQAVLISMLDQDHEGSWTDQELLDLASVSTPLGRTVIDRFVREKNFKGLKQLMTSDNLQAQAKGYLVEASAYQNSHGLREEGQNLLSEMISRGNVAEALAATDSLAHYPELSAKELSKLTKSLCRFKGNDGLGFELMRSRIERLRAQGATQLGLNCRS